MSDIYESEEFNVSPGDLFEIRLTYSYNDNTGQKEGKFNRILHLKVVSKTKPISVQLFINTFINAIVLNAFAKMQSKDIKWEKLVIKDLKSKNPVIQKKLRGVYGTLDKIVELNRAFQFDLHSANKTFPNRCYLRGVPEEFRQFDRKGFEQYAAIVQTVERVFLTEFGNDVFKLRLITVKRKPGSRVYEITQINTAEGTGLVTFKNKVESVKRPAKPVYVTLQYNLVLFFLLEYTALSYNSYIKNMTLWSPAAVVTLCCSFCLKARLYVL